MLHKHGPLRAQRYRVSPFMLYVPFMPYVLYMRLCRTCRML
jgi:hypothetical protein